MSIQQSASMGAWAVVEPSILPVHCSVTLPSKWPLSGVWGPWQCVCEAYNLDIIIKIYQSRVFRVANIPISKTLSFDNSKRHWMMRCSSSSRAQRYFCSASLCFIIQYSSNASLQHTPRSPSWSSIKRRCCSVVSILPANELTLHTASCIALTVSGVAMDPHSLVTVAWASYQLVLVR